jgi:hypothetical protein
VKIRRAEPRDIQFIVSMMYNLTAWLEECGQWTYARDRKKFANGINSFVVGKMLDEANSLILVGTDENDDAVSLLIGGLRQMEPFFEYDILGEVQWVYPFNPSVRQMERVFEEWAVSKGAQALSNFSTPGNSRVEEFFKHEGRKIVWNYFIRPCEE